MINKSKNISNIAFLLSMLAIALFGIAVFTAPLTTNAASNDAGYIYRDGSKYYFYSYKTTTSKRYYPPSASNDSDDTNNSNNDDDEKYAPYGDPGCKPGFIFSQTSGLRCPPITTTSPYYGNTGPGGAHYTPAYATTTPVNSNTSGTTTTTTAGTVTVNQTPVIYSVTPNITKSKSNEVITVKIIGNNFISTSIAKWNGSNRETIYVNEKELAMKLTSADISGLGDYIITVFNTAPGGGYSNAVLFNIKNEITGSDLSASVATGASTNGLHIGLLGWIMIIIFVILIVILWRKFYLQIYLQKKNEELERQELEKEELEMLKKQNNIDEKEETPTTPLYKQA